VISALSLATLIILTLWSFELRSILHLSRWILAISSIITLFLYGMIYRRFPIRMTWNSGDAVRGLAISILFTLLVFPLAPLNERLFVTVVIIALAFFLVCVSLVFPLHQYLERSILGHTFLYIAMIAGVCGMAIILINGFSVRMYGDDFCYALQRAAMGWIKSSLNFYHIWSARFFSNFLLMGLSDKHWAPIIELTAILCTTFLAAKSWMESGHKFFWPAVLATTFFVPFSIFSTVPDLYKSLYWIASSVAVLPVMIFVSLYFFALAHTLRSKKSNVGIIVLGMAATFAIITTHEVAALGWLLCISILLAIMYIFKPDYRAARTYLIANFFAAVMGMAVLLTSPGITARSLAQGYPPPPSLTKIVMISLSSFAEFIRNITMPYYPYQSGRQPAWLFIISLAGLGWYSPFIGKRRWRTAFLVLITSLMMAFLSFIPGAYATSGSIPLRTQLIPVAFLLTGIYICGLFIPQFSNNIRPNIFVCLIIGCLILGSYKSISQTAKTIQPMRQYAYEWDMRDAISETHPYEIRRINIPWEEYEQEFSCTQDYYLNFAH